MKGTWRQAGHVILVALGLSAVIWAVAFAGSQTLWCREQVLRPGQVCANAEGTKVQTYEERLRATQLSRPIVAVAGLATAAFGVALWRGARREAQADPVAAG